MSEKFYEIGKSTSYLTNIEVFDRLYWETNNKQVRINHKVDWQIAYEEKQRLKITSK
jgi:hypothetical protein